MNGNEDPRAKKVRDILDESQPKRQTRTRKKPTNSGVIYVDGDGNAIGNGNVVNNFINQPPPRQKVYVRTGENVLDAQQKRKIMELVYNLAGVAGAVRKTSPQVKQVWTALNRYMSVNSYHEIKQEEFDKAVKWLQRQKGIVNSMPSARTKNPDWRRDHYKGINARAGEFPDGKERYRQYAQERFGSSSLRELSDDQLKAVYRYVMGWHR